MALLPPRHRRHVKRVGVHVGHQLIQIPIILTGTINVQLPNEGLGQILALAVFIIAGVEFLRSKIHWLR